MKDWRKQLQDARSSEEVVLVTRAFLAGWTPHQLGAVPSDCRPRSIDGSDDIPVYAFKLMQAQLRENSQTAELQAMSAFFTEASNRLSKIAAIARGDPKRLFLTK